MQGHSPHERSLGVNLFALLDFFFFAAPLVVGLLALHLISSSPGKHKDELLGSFQRDSEL